MRMPPPPMPDDDAQDDEEDLIDVAAALDGDEDAFERLVGRHGARVQRRMGHFTRDPGELEELAQDVFVAAYTSLASFRVTAPFRHWLMRVATLTGLRFWKKQTRDRLRFGFDDGLDERPDPVAGPAETARRAESGPGAANDPEAAAALLFDLLSTLPAKDRLAMSLMYLEGLGQDEIAARLGWNRATVAVRIYRAKARLRRLGNREPWQRRLAWMTS